MSSPAKSPQRRGGGHAVRHYHHSVARGAGAVPQRTARQLLVTCLSQTVEFLRQTESMVIDDGDTGAACDQLRNVLNRIDGNPRPPDFVIGAAVPELRSRVLALPTELGCVP